MVRSVSTVILFSEDHTQYGSSIGATMGGPVLSFAEQLTKLLITNPQKALQGEETSFGADALKTARMITPIRKPVVCESDNQSPDIATTSGDGKPRLQ